MSTATDRSALIAHDTRLGELHGTVAKADQQVTSAKAHLDWALTRNYDNIDEANDRVAKASAAWTAAWAAVHEHEEAYTGWARFFLVTNVGGHIHSSMSCQTCYPTTQFALLPDLSGLEAADAVEDQGEILCSVCFPDAPSSWTTGVAKATLAERDARAAAKAERAAKKAAKAIRADGEPLMVPTGRWNVRIETISAAKAWLTDAYQWNEGKAIAHPAYPLHAVELVAEALADRTGETVAEVKAAAQKRAAKRR